MLPETLVSGQEVQFSLELLQLRLVVVLLELLTKVQPGQNIDAVDAGSGGRRLHHHGSGREVVQAGPEALQQDLAHRELLVAGVRGFHDNPGRIGGAREPQGALRHLPEFVVELEVLPVPLGHPPAGLRILLQLQQPLLLRPLGKVHPELDDESPLVDQHLLEAPHPVHVLVQTLGSQVSLDPLQNGPGVPAPVEDAHLPLRRKEPPVTPHVRPLQFLVGGVVQAVHLDVPRIHPLVEGAHHGALARPVHTRNEDDHRELPGGEKVVLGIQQGLAQGGHLLLPDVLVDAMAQLGRFEHGRLRWNGMRPPIPSASRRTELTIPPGSGHPRRSRSWASPAGGSGPAP